MVRTAFAASALMAALPLLGILPSSSAEAGACRPEYGCYIAPHPCGYRGDCGKRYTYQLAAPRYAPDGWAPYGPPPLARIKPSMGPYYVNGCYNGYSADDGVACYYSFYRYPPPGIWPFGY
jgi:hypothetical protein